MSFEARMSTVEFQVGERAHITVDSDVCRSCTTKACVTACPANLFAPDRRRRDPFQLRAMFRMRHVLPGVQLGGGAHVDLPGRWARRGVPSWLIRAERHRLRVGGTAVGGPVVVACLAPADLRPEVDPLTGAVRVDPRRGELTASDAAALEHARRAAEAWGGRLVAVAAGSSSVDAGLRHAVAAGAVAWRLPWGDDGAAAAMAGGRGTGPHGLDGVDLAGDQPALARLLAAALSRLGPPDLVICGDRSSLGGTGALPAWLAHELGVGQALGLVSLQVDEDGVIAERRLDGGWRERLRVTPPAVCSVEAAGVRLRRASLSDALDAAGAGIPVWPGGVGTGWGPASGTGGAAGVGRVGAVGRIWGVGDGGQPLAHRCTTPLPATHPGGTAAAGDDAPAAPSPEWRLSGP